MRPDRAFVTAAIAAFLTAGAPAWGALPAPSGAKSALTLARALAYDANLRDRAGSTVVLTVLFRADHGASEKEAREVAKVFKSLESVTIAGLPFRVTSVPFVDAHALEASVVENGVDVVYLCPGLEDDLPAIKSVSRKKKILTMAGNEEFARLGASLAVETTDRPRIVVNLKESREEGALFATGLLRLAKVIR
jgi:hypothetical protein